MPAAKRLKRVGAVALVLSTGCVATPDRQVEETAPPPTGSRLVVGSSLDQWNLLLIPAEGGAASLRDLANPDLVLWESSTRLPAVSAAVTTTNGITALQSDDGLVFRFEPRSDELTRVGTVRGGGAWTVSDGHLLYVSVADSTLLQMSRDGNWRYKIGKPIEWAGVVEDGGVAVLVRNGEQRELWLLRRGESEPAEKVDLPLAAPGVVTAWGRRLALAGHAGSSPALQFIAVPELTDAGSEEIDAPPTTMVASPSSHVVYVADGDGALVSVNRLTGTVRRLARFDAPVEGMRPSALGGYLLVRSGSDVYRVSLDGETRGVDTEWTPDLPLGLPDGRVLVRKDGRVAALSTDGTSSDEISGNEGGGHWALVAWNPAPPVVAGRVEGVPLEDEEGTDGSADDEQLPAPEAPAVGAEPGGARLAAGDMPPSAGEPPSTDLIPSERLLGFYTIVASARSYPGVLSLTQSLEAAGWPTAIQTHQDDAGVIWYRGLVGPYANRQGAEAAARQLRRERDLQVWVTEIGTGFPAQDAIN